MDSKNTELNKNDKSEDIKLVLKEKKEMVIVAHKILDILTVDINQKSDIVSSHFIRYMNAAHTAEHLFAGNLRKLNPNLSILKVDQSDNKNSIYVDVESLDWETVLKAEIMTNQIISEGRNVLEHIFKSLKEAKLKFPNARAMEERITGTTRIVEIDGYDYAACSQKHASNTKECEFFLVTRIVKSSSGLKIDFLVGDDAKQKSLNLSKIALKTSDILGAPINNVEKTVENMVKELKYLRSNISFLSEKESNDVPFTKREDITIYSTTYRNLSIKKIMKRAGELIENPAVIVLIANIDTVPTIIFSRSSDLTFNSDQILKKVLTQYGGKGGGRPNFASGNVRESVISEVFQSILKEIFN